MQAPGGPRQAGNPVLRLLVPGIPPITNARAVPAACRDSSMSRFFKSAAFPILIVVVLAFFAQKLIGSSSHGPN